MPEPQPTALSEISAESPSPTPTATPIAETVSAEPTVTQPPTQTPTPIQPVFIIYIVKAGDNLYTIAEEYKTTAEAIQAANDLADINSIWADQELKIPQGNPAIVTSVAESPSASTTPSPTLPAPSVATPILPDSVIGYSYNGTPLDVYTFGDGARHVAIVGAIHGGYEWNSAVLAYYLRDHFAANPQLVPDNITLHIIPAANPDGINAIPAFTTTSYHSFANVAPSVDNTTDGRTNGRDVDLNRNWDCNWQESAEWRYGPLNPGTEAFSEPETQALRDYLHTDRAEPMAAVVFLHSAAGIVAPGRCGASEHAGSLALSRLYAESAGIYATQYFTAYPVTGDASDWFVDQDVPSFTVELTTHSAIEFDENLRGTLALLGAISAETEAQPETE
jgi:g-D-glutamyl-meso-diaminopimelate peptidase